MNEEACTYFFRSEYAQARKILCDISQIRSAEKDPWRHAWCLMNIAEIDVITGRAEQDVHMNLDKASKIMRTMNVPTGLTYCETVLADLHLREGNITCAKVQFQRGLRSSWGKYAEVVIYCLDRLADVRRWIITDFGWSSRWTVVYLAYTKRSQKKFELHKALQFLGDIFLSQGDTNTAHTLYTVALDEFTHLDVHRSRAECMLHLGDIAKQRGDVFKAVQLWKDARPLFEQSSQANEVAKIDTRLADG
ncbi:hypothetical protein FB451DRAFT_1189594 [Mycena latifolia]|nr:hypothetical protein FB451DRAFT_1189594 [Mycena latifolia]